MTKPADSSSRSLIPFLDGKKDLRDHTRINNYTKYWAEDSREDSETQRDNRVKEYEDVVNGYYDGATNIYEFGWSQSFHLCRFFKGDSISEGIARHEHYLSSQIGLKPGMTVLDLGCGIGGPAREIARFSGARIIGLNNNAHQVEKAKRYTKAAGLGTGEKGGEGLLGFIKADFTKLSDHFPKNSIDAVYAIEATVHAPTWESAYGEIFKVLKPGGVAGIYEWVMTDKWEPSNPHHKAIAHGIELGDGIAEMRNAKSALDALIKVGFEIEVAKDLADQGDEIPWYYPLEGKLSQLQAWQDAHVVFGTSNLGSKLTASALYCAESIGILPTGTYSMEQALIGALRALRDGGKEGLFTPMMFFKVRKPLTIA